MGLALQNTVQFKWTLGGIGKVRKLVKLKLVFYHNYNL